jgi:hypothetical protein
VRQSYTWWSVAVGYVQSLEGRPVCPTLSALAIIYRLRFMAARHLAVLPHAESAHRADHMSSGLTSRRLPGLAQVFGASV